MAKSATKDRPKFKPRRNRSTEDRNKGRGQFLTLKKTGETFLGYALFVADPERDDNPGYYEYMEHYTQADGYVPCMESDDAECPICEDGDTPSTRAKAVFLIVDEEDDDPSEGTLKIFNLNWYVLQEFAEDETDALGQLYRVRKKEGQGQFSIRPKSGSKLTKTQLKAAGKEMPDLEKITSNQVAKFLQEIGAAEALSEEEADQEAEEKASKKDDKSEGSKARKGQKVEEESSDAFDPDEADEFEGTVTVKKVNKKNDILTVTTEDDVEFDIYGTDKIELAENYSKGDEIALSAEKDSDGDFVVQSVEEAEQPEEETKDEPEVTDALEGVECSIVSIDTEKETMTVEDDDGDQHEIFFLDSGDDDEGNDWSDFALDDYEEGDKVTVTATKDEDGDLLASVFPEKAAKAGKKSGKKSGKK